MAGLNIEGDGKSAYNNVQVGGAPTQRISERNSTGNASWGWGSNIEGDGKLAYINVQVGVGVGQR
ncbi:hypothetical protein [Staphylococcus argenteus]|uniref:hypothetical protein n=1 Tax=Staphylococcus argenteus TaxID=985002 RepID=UPI00068EE82E|nr:hypothetical protein [Staphylococcus argenteus]MBE2133883.1 hypothetical protein [Staphylococcus argenteus]MBE2145687.1 hypothetical protein [Staphylococcus argenteus]MCG9799062.1 hypothetical protein [Staphylococcus argenteus]MCG9821864.1 hypothetical protein [Staphylococcus argenteus]MCG9835799.1 hypothetical protein [Staphylococcus argenteus]